jgi:hypothetical protein
MGICNSAQNSVSFPTDSQRSHLIFTFAQVDTALLRNLQRSQSRNTSMKTI